MFMYLLEEISQKRAFSVDPPSRFDRGVIVAGGLWVTTGGADILECYLQNFSKLVLFYMIMLSHVEWDST